MESKVKESDKRYFIAIVPPPPVYDQVQELKYFFRDNYHTTAALNSPPHITLHMPFEWSERKESILCDKLEVFFAAMKGFHLQLLNFSCFAPKTIFIHVAKTKELEKLENELHRFCKKEFNLFNARYKDLPFHPHLTVAFRDMSKTTFAEAWKEFSNKKFSSDFYVDKIVLLKHNGKIWEPLRDFLLN